MRSSADLTAASMISYHRLSYICSDFNFSETILKKKYFSAEAAINKKL